MGRIDALHVSGVVTVTDPAAQILLMQRGELVVIDLGGHRHRPVHELKRKTRVKDANEALDSN